MTPEPSAFSTPAQASLEGFDAPRAIDNLFFAFMPDAPALEQARVILQTLGRLPGTTPRPLASLHVTLFHVGNFAGVPDHVVDQACRAAGTLKAQPIEIRFDRLASFAGAPGRLPQVLLGDESPSLAAFQALLTREMRQAGLNQGSRQSEFKPHLTVAYGPQPLREQAIDPIAWTAREWVLIRSLVGQGRYETLGRWPLPL